MHPLMMTTRTTVMILTIAPVRKGNIESTARIIPRLYVHGTIIAHVLLAMTVFKLSVSFSLSRLMGPTAAQRKAAT